MFVHTMFLCNTYMKSGNHSSMFPKGAPPPVCRLTRDVEVNSDTVYELPSNAPSAALFPG